MTHHPTPGNRRATVEFDESEAEHAGNDTGWTVGYLDVLLLLVTLFAALLAATYLQINQLRSAQALDIQPLALVTPAVPDERPPLAPSATPPRAQHAGPPEPADGPSTDEATRSPTRAPNKPEAIATPNVPSAIPSAEETESPMLPIATNVPKNDDSKTLAASTLEPHPAEHAAAENTVSPTQREQTVAGAPAPPDRESPVASPVTRDSVALEAESKMPAEFIALWTAFARYEDRQDLELLIDRQQLRLEVGDGILFESGTAELEAAGRAMIAELVTAVADNRLNISVEGHTDNVPINTPRFPSNWELSSIRATTVARELMALGIPQHRIQVTGHADTRPRAPNDSAANRALNRRVSLVLEFDEDA